MLSKASSAFDASNTNSGRIVESSCWQRPVFIVQLFFASCYMNAKPEPCTDATSRLSTSSISDVSVRSPALNGKIKFKKTEVLRVVPSRRNWGICDTVPAALVWTCCLNWQSLTSWSCLLWTADARKPTSTPSVEKIQRWAEI